MPPVVPGDVCSGSSAEREIRSVEFTPVEFPPVELLPVALL